MTIIITGDRSIEPVQGAALTAAVLKTLAIHHPDLTVESFMTGSLETGVERAVRYLVPNVPTFKYSETDDGKTDFAGTYELLRDVGVVDLAVVIHGDPLQSRVTKAVMKVFPADRVWLPLQDGAKFEV